MALLPTSTLRFLSTFANLTTVGLWIFKGKIVDPYGEFMVEEHMDQQKENLNDDVNDAYLCFPHRSFFGNKEESIISPFVHFEHTKILGTKIHTAKESNTHFSREGTVQLHPHQRHLLSTYHFYLYFYFHFHYSPPLQLLDCRQDFDNRQVLECDGWVRKRGEIPRRRHHSILHDQPQWVRPCPHACILLLSFVLTFIEDTPTKLRRLMIWLVEDCWICCATSWTYWID